MKASRLVIARSLLAVVIAGACSMSAVQGASAVPRTAPDTSQIDRYWQKAGVSPQVRAQLVAKVKAGHQPDSMRKQAVGTKTALDTESYSGVRTTFADGSLSEATLEKPTRFIEVDTPMPQTSKKMMVAMGSPTGSKTQCTQTSYTNYLKFSGCKITGTNGQVAEYFYITYYVGRSASSYLESKGHDSGLACVFPVACDPPGNTRYVQYTSGSKDAGTTWRMRYEYANAGSGTALLSLTLESSGRTTVSYVVA